MVHGIHGYPVAAAVVCGTLGVALWCYKHHFQRFTAWCFGAAGFFLAIGIPAWTDSLAGLALTGGGLLALTVVTMVSGLIFYLEAFRSAGKPGKLGVFLRWLHMLPARRGPCWAATGTTGSAPTWARSCSARCWRSISAPRG